MYKTATGMAAAMALSLGGAAWASEHGEGSGAMEGEGPPNILVIWGDDIGWSNLSAYEHR